MFVLVSRRNPTNTMSETYYKAIEKLKEQYLPISRNQTVLKAIKILEKRAKAAEVTCDYKKDMDFKDLIQCILEKLNTEKLKRSMSNIDMMRVITDTFLSDENFIKVNDEYHLAGYDSIYTFKLRFMDDPNTVVLDRLKNADPNAKHGPKSAAHTFANLPSLMPNCKITDAKILKKELRSLNADLKRTWEYVHIVKTPSVSELSDLSDKDFE